ncbi:uncharacterized protein BXZ73DRAFT_102517 [Epithele typhae]|uniref:uncharacterized protein n=1 Tax=Epithele typhae TaxID=378194 RepID=UPI002008496A|nr:uncharacterized protein BXZ73DRAFT_102517 [Epithele typhae]KAH9928011.1 hypothetical protein BXZ73DRAFT_102517 [Epithele typhae]
MDDGRPQTLEALEQFIQGQKTALEKTLGDIDRLRGLRDQVAAESSVDPRAVEAKLRHPSFKLSEQLDAMPPLPANIDWSLFRGADPAPFKAMAAAARDAYAARNTPPQTQAIQPSPLRQWVAEQCASIAGPLITSFRLPDDLAMLSSDDDEPPDPEELRRAREREKIRELKKRRIVGDGGQSHFGGLGLRRPVSAVFIRRDVEDESAEVDIWMSEGEEEDGAPSALGGGSSAEPVLMAVDTPPTSVSSPLSAPLQLPDTAVRERRPTRKAREAQEASTSAASSSKGSIKVKPRVKLMLGPPPPPPPPPPDQPSSPTEPALDRKGKARSDTYKQAWSVSEQHLLERLLEEIPDGEKNRWAKISKAMNGRRTARQVASRVQKYYEKLKRFGIEMGGSK